LMFGRSCARAGVASFPSAHKGCKGWHNCRFFT
jgi:hypothetical protein